MELNWSPICTVGLLQSPETHVARAVRMEHGGGTWSGRAGTKLWLRIPELWESHAQGQTWETPVRDQMDTNLGSRPSSQHDFIFRESLRNISWGLFLSLFGFLGYVGAVFCYFFFNYRMAVFLHLLPNIAEQVWMDL